MAADKFIHEKASRGEEYRDRLKGLITVCGAGALGSNFIEAATRCGASNVKVIDFDRVEEGNLGTQVYHEADVGALKVNALKNHIYRQTGTAVEGVGKKLELGNAKTLLRGAAAVIDVFDNSASRKVVQDTCRYLGIPCLHAGLSTDDSGEVIWDEHYKVPQAAGGDVCDYPLARNLAMLVVAVLAEEVLDFFLADPPRRSSWTVTLKDLAVRRV